MEITASLQRLKSWCGSGLDPEHLGDHRNRNWNRKIVNDVERSAARKLRHATVYDVSYARLYFGNPTWRKASVHHLAHRIVSGRAFCNKNTGPLRLK